MRIGEVKLDIENGRIFYPVNGEPATKKDKLAMWEALCNATKNFYENNTELLSKK